MTEGRERDPAGDHAARTHTRFVILAAPRTGSNLLCTLLDAHPRILCHHEILNPDGIFYALSLRDGNVDHGSMEERDRDPLGFVDRVVDRARGHDCVGWKLTRGQAEGALDQILEDATTLKIVLRRRNRIRTLVSERIAQQTGRWEMYSEAEVAPEPTGVRITHSELQLHATGNEQFYDSILRILAANGQAPLEVEYETLLTPPCQQRLLSFLRVAPIATTLRPASVRQNPWSLRRLVSNYDELEVALRGSSFHDELVAPSH